MGRQADSFTQTVFAKTSITIIIIITHINCVMDMNDISDYVFC